ncbi:MAG: replicative DNA helicase, partial [Verrucomicrobia bacterium]|nr:replicative DNA helicase [Verrucomicrobiota bacterium]
ELNPPVIVISQLNREVEGRGGKPRLSDLRESGAIEQDADVVGLLARADNSDEPPGVAMPINLIVAKNRNGRQGEVSLTFRLDITKFFPSVLDEGPEPVAKDRPV